MIVRTKIKDGQLELLRNQIAEYIKELESSSEDKILIRKYTTAREKLGREEHKFDNAVRRACGEKIVPYNKTFYEEID